MSMEATKYAVNDDAQSVGAATSDRKTVKTVLICDNSLVGAGLIHLLEGTSFITAGVLPNSAKVIDAQYPLTTELFIIGAGASIEHTIETVRHLKEKHPEARAVIIADYHDLGSIRLARSAGVDGFCVTESSREVLIKSLELVMLGEIVLPATLVVSLLNGNGTVSVPKTDYSHVNAKAHSENLRMRKLSVREAEILGHLMSGSANKVIARKLEVTEATIKVHIKAILRKIGAANRTQAAMWASTHLPAMPESVSETYGGSAQFPA